MVLVTEWIGKIGSSVIGVAFSTSRLPKVLKYTCWPWRWIRTMAPGILPAAISPFRKSSMAERFSRESLAPGGGPNPTVAAHAEVATETAATIAAKRMAWRRNDAKWRGDMCWPDRLGGQ